MGYNYRFVKGGTEYIAFVEWLCDWEQLKEQMDGKKVVNPYERQSINDPNLLNSIICIAYVVLEKTDNWLMIRICIRTAICRKNTKNNFQNSHKVKDNKIRFGHQKASRSVAMDNQSTFRCVRRRLFFTVESGHL